MADGVTLTRDENIGIITLDNPPVNGLSFAVRRGLADQIEMALSDDAIEAIVVRGAGKMFCGGADISQFGQTPPANAVNLPDAINRLEDSPKPVVAAIHGVAAGGGLEVALGCHHRLAAPRTRLGLPEVTLGFVPGAGGTQRLPRLIGVQNALDVIVGGQLLPSDRAHALGIVDEIVEGDLLARAIEFARGLVGQSGAVRKVSERDEGLEDARSNPAPLRRLPQENGPSSSWIRRAVCVASNALKRRSHSHSRPDWPGNERSSARSSRPTNRRRSATCSSPSERSPRFPTVPKDTPTLAVETGAVIGCGTMGGGIAMNFANAGVPVTVFEVSQDALDRGMATIRKNYAVTVSKGRLAQADMESARVSDHADVELRRRRTG